VSAVDVRRESRGFDESVFFVMLADGKPVTMLRAPTSLEGLAYIIHLEKRGILALKWLDEAHARFNVALTDRGLAVWKRVAARLQRGRMPETALKPPSFFF
jgi:hypothetical protein